MIIVYGESAVSWAWALKGKGIKAVAAGCFAKTKTKQIWIDPCDFTERHVRIVIDNGHAGGAKVYSFCPLPSEEQEKRWGGYGFDGHICNGDKSQIFSAASQP